MKKYLILVLIVLLIGALIIGVPAAKEGKVPHGPVAKVEKVVKDYFKAANKLDWENALSCCKIDSVAYLDTQMTRDEIESVIGSFRWKWKISITDTSIEDEQFAEVYFDFTVTVTVGGDKIRLIGWEDAILYLEKVEGKWLIYNSENLDYFLPDN